MKRSALFSAVAAAAFALAGCNAPQPSAAPDTAPQTTDVAEKEQEAKVHLVVFYAQWCPICKSMAEDLAAFHRANGDMLRIVDIDTDEGRALMDATRINGAAIEGVPALVTLRNGDIVGGTFGKQTLAQMNDLVATARDVPHIDMATLARASDTTGALTAQPARAHDAAVTAVTTPATTPAPAR